MNQSRQTCLSWFTAVLIVGLPVCAHAGLYKCVDEKTKAITYSGTPCVSGNESKLSITENAIMDGAAAQREIARRQTQTAYGGQSSQPCQAPIGAAEQVRKAEFDVLVAKNAHGADENTRTVKNAQANAQYARDMQSNPCDPSIAQQHREASAAAMAADDARRRQQLQNIQMMDMNNKLDNITRQLRY